MTSLSIVRVTYPTQCSTYSKMIIRLLLLAILAIAVLGHRIEIDPGEKQCFFEALQPQDKVSARERV